MSYFYNYTNITLIIFLGKMVRSRGRDGSIIRLGQPRRRDVAIDLGRIPYSGLSPSSDGSPHGSHSSTRLPPTPHPPLTHQILRPPSHLPPTMHLHYLALLQPYQPTILMFHHPLIPPLVIH